MCIQIESVNGSHVAKNTRLGVTIITMESISSKFSNLITRHGDFRTNGIE